MNGVKTTLGELCEVEGKSVLQAVEPHDASSRNAFVANAPDLNEIGVRILQMGQFNLNFSEEDRARLVAANAEIAKANRGVKIAEAAGEGEAVRARSEVRAGRELRAEARRQLPELRRRSGDDRRRAGHGRARRRRRRRRGRGHADGDGRRHGEPDGGRDGSRQAAAAPQQRRSSRPAARWSTCAKCNTRQPGGKFCAECGGALAQAKKFCTGCGQEIAAPRSSAPTAVRRRTRPPRLVRPDADHYGRSARERASSRSERRSAGLWVRAKLEGLIPVHDRREASSATAWPSHAWQSAVGWRRLPSVARTVRRTSFAPRLQRTRIDSPRRRLISLASFADELALSLEPSHLEDETTATQSLASSTAGAGRGSSTSRRPFTGSSSTFGTSQRRIASFPRQPWASGRSVPAASHPARGRLRGPGRRELLACVETLVDLRGIDELEVAADLAFPRCRWERHPGAFAGVPGGAATIRRETAAASTRTACAYNREVLRQLTAVAFVALGLSRDPGCGGVDDPEGGPNAPCTRTSDCRTRLVCLEGVCREPDAGQVSGTRDSGSERDSAAASGDGGDGGG